MAKKERWYEDERIQRFAREKIPSQVYGTHYLPGGFTNDDFREVPEIGLREVYVKIALDTIGKEFFLKHKSDSYEVFSNALIHNLREMAAISNYLSSKRERATIDFVDSFFSQAPSMPFEKKVKDCWLNARFSIKWEKNRQEIIGEFVVKPALLSHFETPLLLEILNLNGERVATLGFLLYHKKGKLTVRITNIQGVKGRVEDIEKLNKAIGENWRVFFLKRFLEKAQVKKIVVEGKLPGLYGHIFPGAAPKEHKRQIRQYTQTYKKAGMKPIGKIWKFTPKRNPR